MALAMEAGWTKRNLDEADGVDEDGDDDATAAEDGHQVDDVRCVSQQIRQCVEEF